MGLLDTILGMFGGGSPDYGKIDPNDVEQYWDADADIDDGERAERKGQAGAQQQALAKWGMRDMKQWEKAKEAILQRHASNPEFAAAASRVSMRRQMASVQAQVGDAAAAHPLAPAHGVALHDVVRAQVIRERSAGAPDAEIWRKIASATIDTQNLAAAEQEWYRRMDSAQNPTYAATVRAQYDMLLAQTRSSM
jgi:hypothetical protein